IFGFPLVDSYRIQYAYFVDRGGPEYKAPGNQIFNNARVYTPEDRAIQTPNSDTPYSYIGADLRAEPLVLSVPAVEKGRYYSLQFIDMFTFNFAYVGSRATGNGPGRCLLAGPGWKGRKPAGIKAVIRSETDFVFVLYRTQLFNPGDIEKVKKIQAGYTVQPLSAFLGEPAPPEAPPRGVLGAARAASGPPHRLHQAAQRGSGTHVAAVLQRSELRPRVLRSAPVGEGHDGALLRAEHRCREDARHPGAVAGGPHGRRGGCRGGMADVGGREGAAGSGQDQQRRVVRHTEEPEE